MSEIDKRVVELELDNTQFNKDVKSTNSKINDLKKTLNFDDVSDSIDKFQMKFSSLDVAAMAVISNITNRVVNMGISLVKSLSIDNVSAGWSKFEQKTKSVATIMSQTIKIAGKELDNYNDKMEAVDNQLNKLNWFTDQTSYSFTDMVDNIGKFTAAGQDLDKSVAAMMGIANWAALSGQNATTASRAMYQLAQAMSKGNVQLIDYKSIQNANMDTQEFRQTVLDTAVALGELQKQGDSYIAKNGGSKFTRNQFTESLSSKWFTADVLTASLEKYSSAVDRLYEISEETGLTAAQVMARYSSEFDEFGLKAFKAAQEARTFTDTINAIKDAVSTGWLNTSEMIFGSYTESKVLWSDLADSLYEVFAAGGDIRNEILSIWGAFDGRADLFAHDPNHPESQGAFWNIYDAIVSLVNVVKTSFRQIFSMSDFQSTSEYVNDIGSKLKTFTLNLKDSTKKFKDFIENNKLFGNVMKTIFASLKIAINTIKAVRYALDPIISTVTNFVRNILTNISNRLSSISWIEKILAGIAQKASKVHDILYDLINRVMSSGTFNSIIDVVQRLFTAIKDYNILGKVASAFKDFFTSFSNNGGTINNFYTIATGLVSILLKIGLIAKNFIKTIANTLAPAVSQVFGNLFKVLGAVFGKLIELFASFFDSVKSLNNSESPAGSIVDGIVEFISSFKVDTASVSMAEVFVSVVSSLKDTIYNLLVVIQYMVPLVNAFLKIMASLVKSVASILSNILAGLSERGGIKVLIIGFLAVLTILVALLLTVSKTVKRINGIMDGIRSVMTSFSRLSSSNIFVNIAISILLIASSLYMLSRMNIKQLGISLLAMTAIVVVLIGMYILLYKLSEVSKDSKKRLKDFSKNAGVLIKIGIAFVAMAISLNIISKAINRFATIDGNSLWQGIVSAIAMLASLILATYVFDKINPSFKNIFKMQLAAFVLASVSLSMVRAFNKMQSVDWAILGLGILKMSIFMGILAGVCIGLDKLTKRVTVSVKNMLKMDILAVSISFIVNALVKTIKKLSEVDFTTMATSLVKLAVTLLTMVGIMEFLNSLDIKTGRIILIGFTLSLFAASLRASSKELQKIADVPFLQILKGILNLAMILASIIAIQKLNIKVGKIIAVSISIEFLGAAMSKMARAFATMQNVSWDASLKSIANILILLGMLVAMSKLDMLNPMKLIGMAIAVSLLGSALVKYATGLETLNAVSWSSLFKGIVTLVAGLTILGAVAKIMNPSVTAILKISFAVLVLGGALLIVTTALRALAETFEQNVEGMWGSLTEFLYGALDFIDTNLNKIIELISNVLVAILQAIINVTPKLGEVLATIIKMVLKVIRDVMPDLLKVIGEVITGVLKLLKKSIGTWTKDVCDILIIFIQTLTSELPRLIEALGNFLETFIVSSLDDLSKRIGPILNSLISFVLNLIRELGITFKKRAREFGETFVEFGMNIMEGLMKGIGAGVAKLLEQIPVIGGAVAEGFRNVFGIHSPSTVMAEMGMYLDKGLAKGVEDNADATADEMAESMSRVISAVNDTIESEADDSLTLTPVLDLSQVNKGARNIDSLMSSISGKSVSVTGSYATKASAGINSRASQTQTMPTNTVNNSDNYYVTFNVETNDPEELARKTDAILQRNRLRTSTARGGY